MPGTLKAYYLLQASYWCQQFLLLTLRMEKPRSDYKELVAHHIVTLWLIGWSYLVNLTLIGNAVYLTMDWSDIFLAVRRFLWRVVFSNRGPSSSPKRLTTSKWKRQRQWHSLSLHAYGRTPDTTLILSFSSQRGTNSTLFRMSFSSSSFSAFQACAMLPMRPHGILQC